MVRFFIINPRRKQALRVLHSGAAQGSLVFTAAVIRTKRAHCRIALFTHIARTLHTATIESERGRTRPHVREEVVLVHQRLRRLQTGVESVFLISRATVTHLRCVGLSECLLGSDPGQGTSAACNQQLYRCKSRNHVQQNSRQGWTFCHFKNALHSFSCIALL